MTKPRFQLNLKHDYKLTKVSEWAEENRVLPGSLSALSGKYGYDFTPYLREIADSLSIGSGISEVAFKKSAQIGATTGILENFIGYIIANSPGPAMYATSIQKTAEEQLETRFFPMLELSGLKDKLIIEDDVQSDKKNKKQAAKKDIIRFAGGFLVARGLASVPGLKSVSVKYLVLDEIDEGASDLGGQGDPVKLARTRTQSMPSRKILYISTPTNEGESRIERYYQKGDCRKYHVSCPECDYKQHLEWGNLKYNVDDNGKLIEESIGYMCQGCGVLIKESEKKKMVAEGEWIPTKKAEKRGYRSYHLNALYSPSIIFSWEEIIQEYLEVKDIRSEYKSWRNNLLGETFEDKAASLEDLAKTCNRLDYNMGEVPEGVCFITTATDVQRNGLYIEVLGWGYNRQSYLIDFMFLEGDTSNGYGSPVWEKHKEVISRFYNDKIYSRCNFIDSGDQTQIIYDYCDKFSHGVIPIKGQRSIVNNKPFSSTFLQKKELSVHLVNINTYYYKDNLFDFLGKKHNPEKSILGFCNFAINTPDNYFKMLESEEKVPVTTLFKGEKTLSHIYKRKSKENHGLDTRVYNMAAADFVVNKLKEKAKQALQWDDVCKILSGDAKKT